MALSIEHVTINSTDPVPLAQFWAGVLGGSVEDQWGGAFVKVKLDAGPGVAVQWVEGSAPGPQRVHVDLVATHLEDEVERVVGLGAVVEARHGDPATFAWVVLNDPQGNVFCISAHA